MLLRFQRRRPNAAAALAVGLFLAVGCSSARPVTRYGHDLVENDGYHPVTRAFAGCGALLGHILAFPVAVLALPTYAFEGARVRSADGYPLERFPEEPVDLEAAEVADGGDICIPWVLAPFDYGSGFGAALLGGPFEGLSRACGREPPPPPRGAVPERLEQCDSGDEASSPR